MLKAYDTYYYDYSHRKSLPIFLVRLADSRHTWLQAMGLAGPHDLDHRPAWDLTVIVLSIGGMALIVTSMVLAWKYLLQSTKRNVRAAQSLRAESKYRGKATIRSSQ